MLKSLPRISPLIALAAALAAPVYAQQTPKSNESPWAMRPPSPQAAPTLSAQQEAAAEKGTRAQQAFARRVSDAMLNQDYGAIKDLFPPSTVECIGKTAAQFNASPIPIINQAPLTKPGTPAATGPSAATGASPASAATPKVTIVHVDPQDFLQDRIRKQLALPMNRKYKLSITKLPPNVMRDNKFATYPMRPTSLMTMEFETADGSNDDTVNLPIGQEDGKWYEVQPCPTPVGWHRFAELREMQAQHLDQAKAALAKVHDPIKSQLIAMAARHDNLGAWKLCMASLHLDFPTCHGVVDLLSGRQSGAD
jgi:hypothetical protein